MRKIFWSFLEIFETVIIAVAAVVIIRTFVAQPFLVSGSSMEPSFQSGDYLLVDELAYRFREPQRGEVVVFENPSDDGSYYIKRIVGLPGEEVLVSGDEVIVSHDGKELILKENYVSNNSLPNIYEEKLKMDEYFVMGDNRGFSFDSRNWGPLDDESIVGLVRLRLWPISKAMAIEAPTY